jgi:hypothetical protein
MIQSGSGSRLALEPLQGHSVGSQPIGQELQGNVAPQSQVPGPCRRRPYRRPRASPGCGNEKRFGLPLHRNRKLEIGNWRLEIQDS